MPRVLVETLAWVLGEYGYLSTAMTLDMIIDSHHVTRIIWKKELRQNYHRIPAPWIQMKIVRILSVIGKNDSNSSEGMYEVVADCLRKADEAGINASNAIVYECIRCITTIYPNPVLLDAAGASI